MLLGAAALGAGPAAAHEATRPDTVPVRFAVAGPPAGEAAPETLGRLILRPVDASGTPSAANVRITSLETASPIELSELYSRPNGWHAQAEARLLTVRAGRYRVEAFRGIDTELAEAVVEISAGSEPVELVLPLVHLQQQTRWLEGNTHLHLGDVSLERAKDYLQVVGATDGLDFVWVSHLTRTGADHRYASNLLDVRTTHALDTEQTRFGWGQEHRHNFPPNLNGYGHALLLEIPETIEPVSLGRVLAAAATDGVPLRGVMARARTLGGTVLWAHNDVGFEDIPSWLGGFVDVQNVWDGGSPLGLEGSVYRYLDIGLDVPLSSGTDWWVRSLSRVRVDGNGSATRASFLAALRAGRSTVTTGPLLDLRVDGAGPGQSVALAAAGTVRVQAEALSRVRFEALELLRDGRVIARREPEAVAGHWEAHIDERVAVAGSAWMAVRVPLGALPTEFGGPLLAHSSAVEIEVAGARRFDPVVARGLVLEMDWNRREILRRGVFADEEETATVVGLYDEAIESLEARLPLLERLRSILTRWLRTMRSWVSGLL